LEINDAHVELMKRHEQDDETQEKKKVNVTVRSIVVGEYSAGRKHSLGQE
jgi:hypothetical protein